MTWRALWLLALLPSLLAMGGQPWERGVLVEVGAYPLVKLGIERSDGAVLAIRPAEPGKGLDQAALKQLRRQLGHSIRYRAAGYAESPVYGREVILQGAEAER
ncbi:hypothetical protein [Chromobacterium vaccinii]|uniref:Uncharacterized protein n=1 Tax=Chromobacterium vaccinii TaxID=1108595 RepID=A0A1D9LJW0_9NEIS|nr:hypothetical protein [Chromobacterium vaccinii]AOZ51517.1 hypothetical protein BKX93_16930 [Chromobacterium vaccinii]